MATLKLPSGLKAAQWKHAAFLMGLPTAGTKSELERSILHCLSTPPLLSRPTKVVSVDMGIRNLGVCVLETRSMSKSAKANSSVAKRGQENSTLTVLAWKKLDVLSNLSSQQEVTPIESENLGSAGPSNTERKRGTSSRPFLNATAFAPASLSKVALSIAQDLHYTYKPDHILIERQRFRSGGAAAVQEWTLRVNMLESMIWACLETMRAETKSPKANVGLGSFPTVHEISPARVAKFWCLGPSSIRTVFPNDLLTGGWKGASVSTTSVPKNRSKIEKKDKIAVVRSWLEQSEHAKGDSTVALDLNDESQSVADSFLTDTNGRRKQVSNSTGKLDDLADCLLQGAAWVRWEENRQRMMKIIVG